MCKIFFFSFLLLLPCVVFCQFEKPKTQPPPKSKPSPPSSKPPAKQVSKPVVQKPTQPTSNFPRMARNSFQNTDPNTLPTLVAFSLKYQNLINAGRSTDDFLINEYLTALYDLDYVSKLRRNNTELKKYLDEAKLELADSYNEVRSFSNFSFFKEFDIIIEGDMIQVFSSNSKMRAFQPNNDVDLLLNTTNHESFANKFPLSFKNSNPNFSKKSIFAEIFYTINKEQIITSNIVKIVFYDKQENGNVLFELNPFEVKDVVSKDANQMKWITDSINKIVDAKLAQEKYKDSVKQTFKTRVAEANTDMVRLANSGLENYLADYFEEFKRGKFNYKMKCYFVVNENGRATEISFEDSSSIQKQLWNSIVREYIKSKLFKTISQDFDGKTYNFQTIYPKIQVHFQSFDEDEVWVYHKNSAIKSLKNKDLVPEELSSIFFNKFKRRPWKGRYDIRYQKRVIGEESRYSISSIDLKRAYCIQIGFNFGMLPIAKWKTNINPLKLYVPSVSLLHTYFGLYYTYGFYNENTVPIKSYPSYIVDLPNSVEKLSGKFSYHEVGGLVNLGSIVYLKGGVSFLNVSTVKNVVDTDIYYNLKSKNELGFCAALCLYPRYFNAELGYNHTFKSVYAAVGFNIPIKY